MKTIYFLAIVILGVMSVANAEIPTVNPTETSNSSELRCIQLRTEQIGSREECAHRAFEVLKCQFNREAQIKGLINAQLENAKVYRKAKGMDVTDFNSSKTGKTTRVEVLSYGYFDPALRISISARATWRAAERSCAY